MARSLESIEQRKARTKQYKAEHPKKVKAWKHAYYLRHTERIKMNAALYRQANPERVRAWNIATTAKEKATGYARRKRDARKQLYGLTHDEFVVRLGAQEHCCAICAKPFTQTRACVDHNHETGNVRGLLCNNCNVGLGLFKDSTATIQSAARYLAVSH